MSLNGRQSVTIKTIHGRFKFEVQRFKDESGQEMNYLSYTGQFEDMRVNDCENGSVIALIV